MIERLLAADRARAAGELELAEMILSQVAEADPRNAMAVVGQARVALARGDLERAEERARHALRLDPNEAAAVRILEALAPAKPAPGPEAPPEPSVQPPRARRSWWRRLRDRLLGRDLPS